MLASCKCCDCAHSQAQVKFSSMKNNEEKQQKLLHVGRYSTFFFSFHSITIVATSRGVDVLFVPALLVLYWIIVVETTEQICRVHIISLHWNLLNIKFCYKGISESIHAWVGNFKLLQVPDITCGKKHNYALLGFLYIQCLDRPIHLVLLMKRPCFINRTLNSKI